LFNPSHSLGRGPISPLLFGRPVAQKNLKLEKFRIINFYTKIISALKLSSGVSSKTAV
jgi:hypothetical protein